MSAWRNGVANHSMRLLPPRSLFWHGACECCLAALLVELSVGPPSLALDPGQAILDPSLRPGTPGHGEELEPLLDEKVRVHLGRDEIHPSDDAALCGGCRDFIQRSPIGVAGRVEWHHQLDRKIGRADPQDVDARDRGDGIDAL